MEDKIGVKLSMELKSFNSRRDYIQIVKELTYCYSTEYRIEFYTRAGSYTF